MASTVTMYIELDPCVWLDSDGILTPYTASYELDDYPEGEKITIQKAVELMLSDHIAYATGKYDDELIKDKKDGKLDWMLELAEFLTKKHEEIK